MNAYVHACKYTLRPSAIQFNDVHVVLSFVLFFFLLISSHHHHRRHCYAIRKKCFRNDNEWGWCGYFLVKNVSHKCVGWQNRDKSKQTRPGHHIKRYVDSVGIGVGVGAAENHATFFSCFLLFFSHELWRKWRA